MRSPKNIKNTVVSKRFKSFHKKGGVYKKGKDPAKNQGVSDIFNVLSTKLTHSQQRGVTRLFYWILLY